jgi:5-formyltetrahydrofolate cyclo-ligase
LLWFESNGSHRHRRVALPDFRALSSARRQLRAQLNARRRALSVRERAALSLSVARNAARAVPLRFGQRVALYAALPWELDAAPLTALAAARGCRLYLPRIERRSAGRGMRFIDMQGRSRRNRLGIEEPEGDAFLGARWLDVVFLPLIGFDRHGLRLGTGGGYYDRALAFRHGRRLWHGPLLVGLAYAFQELPAIERAPHDVPMDLVVTEKEIIRCTTG